jgi:hypothetical protein
MQAPAPRVSEGLIGRTLAPRAAFLKHFGRIFVPIETGLQRCATQCIFTALSPPVTSDRKHVGMTTIYRIFDVTGGLRILPLADYDICWGISRRKCLPCIWDVRIGRARLCRPRCYSTILLSAVGASASAVLGRVIGRGARRIEERPETGEQG